jgi:hemerythrin superfamily protein
MTNTQTRDIVELLTNDHREAALLLDQICAAGPESRQEQFWNLVPALVQHEVAEEVVVYPAIRRDAPNGDSEADARLAEQQEAEVKLAAMEKMDPTSTQFAGELESLRQAVLDHAHAEEAEVFPLLEKLESPQDRQELGARYEKAKATAPTRPHPHAPDTPPGNVVVGPVAALFDKARDALRDI